MDFFTFVLIVYTFKKTKTGLIKVKVQLKKKISQFV